MVEKESEGLDRMDRRLLASLQEDGRMAIVELAARVGLSPTATTERVKRLTRDGFILGYSARLNPDREAPGLSVSIESRSGCINLPDSERRLGPANRTDQHQQRNQSHVGMMAVEPALNKA